MSRRLLWVDDSAMSRSYSRRLDNEGYWLIDGVGDSPSVEETHKTVFDAIMAYPHPGISGIDADFIANQVLDALGIVDA